MPNDAFNEMEGDVQALLDRAQALTEELSKEVGATSPPAAERDTEFFESKTDSEASLDVQMAQVESAMDGTAMELGSAPAPLQPPPPPVAPPPPPEPPAAPKKSISLPPKKAPAPESSAPVSSAPQTAAPSSARTVVLPGRPAPESKPDTWDDLTPDLVAGSVPNQPFPVDGSDIIGGVGPAPASGATSQALQSVLGGACRVLDVLDRPFTSVPYSVRWWLGWVALVAAGAGISLLLFAVL